MFGRKKTAPEDAQAAPAEKTYEPREGAKNRPTPKRKDQQAARKRPLVVDDRKAAKNKAREQRREAAAKQHQAMLSGDERHLPARDKGPVRRYIRDFVDARWNVGEWLLPIMLITLIVSYARPNAWTLSLTLMLYVIVLFAIGDAVLTWRRIKRILRTKYDEADVRGGGFYTFMRMFQLRRWRMPRPQVARGQFPNL
ncbi:MAG: DUF3043 domain-containing protein [Actinomycetia bacterium]|nr:DUF3043 domain-containing protein [Actinomycetes bacterium]